MQTVLVAFNPCFYAKSRLAMSAMSHDADIQQFRESCHKWINSGIFPIFENTGTEIFSCFLIKKRNKIFIFSNLHLVMLIAEIAIDGYKIFFIGSF